ncbi:MAG TPA: hypothetical protein VF628_02405 [Allosphingosinicella sp.]|jgi:hypothetical protein
MSAGFLAKLFPFLSIARIEQLEAEVAQLPERTGTEIGADGRTERTEAEKIDFHIRRFMLAIDQCEKGPEREAELQGNLEYWQARKAALLLRPE